MNNLHKSIKSALFGVAVGDALGVPVEFKSRAYLNQNPVTGMTGYGTYNMPPGTFSDDSSLTFCLAEALTEEFSLETIGRKFVKWRRENYWTPHGEVFDIGITTSNAIERLSRGTQPDLAGGTEESSNGNGSLMRILPLVFYIADKPISERYKLTKQVSSITHGHIRSVIACFYYLEFARQLLLGTDRTEIYRNLQAEISSYLGTHDIPAAETDEFSRLLNGTISDLPKEQISSSGYVMHTLEASIWCLLTTDCYRDAVLKAINLGDDTDTTAAVTGGLAGLLYGHENIPQEWVNELVRRDDIEALAERMTQAFPVDFP